MKNTAWIVNRTEPEYVSSYRYNAFIPAGELDGLVLPFIYGDSAEHFLSQHELDAIIICKPYLPELNPDEGCELISLAQASRKKGIKVCFHICDWHFDNPVYKTLTELADLVIVQTRYIAAAVEQHFGKVPAIIEEPFEGPRGKPRFKPRKKLKFVWYGHSANLDTLSEGLRQLQSLKHLFKLTIVTNNVDLGVEYFNAATKPDYLIERNITSFSLETQWREISGADIVLIPSFNRVDKQVKGHNRLVQSIQSGRLAITYPSPQYQELADYCYCCKDMTEGVLWALQNRVAVFQRLKSGQEYLDQRFSPAAIAERWKEEISKLIEG